MTARLPLPRPEYERPDGSFAYFNPGDIVRMKDSLDDETKHLVGVVVVDALRPESDEVDWFVRWENGYIDDFDDISGDSLVVVFSMPTEVPEEPAPVVDYRRYNRATDTREYKVTFDLWLSYETEDETLLPCSFSEYIDEHANVLSVLDEHLILSIQSAVAELNFVDNLAVYAGRADMCNVSDVTGEEYYNMAVATGGEHG